MPRRFKLLKNKLVTKPVLQLYDPKLPLHVFCDPSQVAIGAVLKQPDSSETIPGYRIHREKAGQGRSRVTTATEDRYWSIIARRNRGATASQLSRDLYAATGTRVSRVTVSKRLHGAGFFARRLAVCVPLTSTNRRVRLARCREHRDWSTDQWPTVLFTDESR
ncbi:hypothetical protein AVEN_160514-1 [Araneus ventricosus]|uniref:Transposase Tc1-like domain-containing protein n=1 Tax=Araneus ventricosus TaxID=182803 RepID=A0A4Y2SS88_ARAVE|nr:hypothetical protein AVEN_160514-1 [Araneus ventricosus]